MVDGIEGRSGRHAPPGTTAAAGPVHHALRDDYSTEELLADLDRLVETDEFSTKLKTLRRALDRDDDEYARLHLGN